MMEGELMKLNQQRQMSDDADNEQRSFDDLKVTVYQTDSM